VGSFLYAYVRTAEKAKPAPKATAYEKVSSEENDLEAAGKLELADKGEISNEKDDKHAKKNTDLFYIRVFLYDIECR
jgi:hypothetical protein